MSNSTLSKSTALLWYVGHGQDSLPLWHYTSINFAAVDELLTLEVKSRLNVGQRPAQQTQHETIWASRL